MNYYEFLDFYHLTDSNRSWDLFVDFRNLADIIGDSEAIKKFEL